MRKLILVMLLILSSVANAEIYQGIIASSTLGEIKKKFPNASITAVKAAWVTSSDGFYSMTGVGLPGLTYLAFSDSRPWFAKEIADQQRIIEDQQALPDSDNKTKKLKSAKALLEIYTPYANEGDDEALVINWIRWVPTAPIPIARYVAKFGAPTKTAFKDDTMQPYSTWIAKGLSVTLSDDQKFVINVEYSFTPAEQQAGCRLKYGPKGFCGAK
jgi:hypothetical protein